MKKDQFNTNQSSKSKEIFDSRWIAKNLPYVFFLIFLAMIYIANAHKTERKIRKIGMLKNEIRELNWNYMSMKSEAISKGTYTSLSKKVKPLHLSNEGKNPRIIFK